jgi:hypothetical protein
MGYTLMILELIKVYCLLNHFLEFRDILVKALFAVLRHNGKLGWLTRLPEKVVHNVP